MADLGAHPIRARRARRGAVRRRHRVDRRQGRRAGGALVLLRRAASSRRRRAGSRAAARRSACARRGPRPPPPAPPRRPRRGAAVASADAAASAGDLLTHYAPDVPSFLLAVDDLGGGAAAAWRGAAKLARARVVVDYGRRAAALEPLALAYRDSADADGPRAAAVLFETLRWAERQADGGARVILLPDLGGDDDEHVPALADRLYRAASGVAAADRRHARGRRRRRLPRARERRLELCQFSHTRSSRRRRAAA